MKKAFAAAVAALAIIVSFTACGSSGSAETNLTGSTATILENVLNAAAANVGVTELAEVTAEDAQSTLGLSAADFDKYVAEATVSRALMMTSAHEVTLVKVKDGASVADLKAAIAAGFDSTKWICVVPDKSVVIDSGSYVLLVVSYSDTVDAILKAFKDAAGTVGSENVFYTRPV
ncbi:MAG: DUF4358 domain-containing protein [Propionibacteriaceae bacterium]|jgi:hypothetical protein|nr:DUF4358 domain-containing protein [Propionibacteriaceae bacterium]